MTPARHRSKLAVEKCKSFQYHYTGCSKVCASHKGLMQHVNKKHWPLSSDDSENEERICEATYYHAKLTGIPVDAEGHALPKHANPAPMPVLDSEDPWYPFTNIQASGNLECDDLPWVSASKLYRTIDDIQVGNLPFYTEEFRHNGPLPKNLLMHPVYSKQMPLPQYEWAPRVET
ncbi:hypothetical protein FA15DRAFT_661068 [Coprinopsis marcescibilis]|uniref:C2H2-type domain-containing protein n=1 Tax=Coprinopsis marcescibilis TaxID=230819 RepID=A0A5C3KDP8_COPMA|nr:hypothetical protein FA15DRAFT_661068 [Coprinopsis marcescibilis]